MTNYLTAVEELLRTDGIKYHWPEGTDELYSTAANLESLITTLGYLIRQAAEGTARLPNRSHGLRTDTMTSQVDPDTTKTAAITALAQAQRALEAAAVHLGRSHGLLGRLFIDDDNGLAAPASLTVVHDDT